MGETAKIVILDDKLIDKIAAGEVVENPCSVVKELIENSIDAKADFIEIEVREAGKSLIRLRDNGEGMSRNDAELCIKRHATSKIHSEEDLFAIKTLGFRGEALASIAAVSKFTLVTRRKQDIKGTEVKAKKSEIEVNDIGCEKGTVVNVEELFYNVPARKKFLRSIETELSDLIDIVIRYALAYPGISFKLVNHGKIAVGTSKTNDWLNTVSSIYGADTAQNMLKVEFRNELVSVTGFIGKPQYARNDKLRQTIFVNGRYVKSKEISFAVKQGYQSMLFLDKEPVYLLKINIDEKKVDVNVHPRKEIVKISMLKEVCIGISNAVASSLSDSNLVLEATLDQGKAKAQHTYNMRNDVQATLNIESSLDDSLIRTGSVYDNAKSIIETGRAGKELNTEHIGPFKILGQINKTYIIAENAKGLMIIDQHAAEERVNYEKLMKELKEKAVKKQALMKPIIVEASSSEFEMIKQYLDELNKCGFEVEDYGKNNFIVRAVPFVFERASKILITDLIDDLKQLNRTKLSEEIEERIIRFSCRKSIKAGQEIAPKEIYSLIVELDKCRLPFTCPHGRPTIIQLSIADIEKKFKRTG